MPAPLRIALAACVLLMSLAGCQRAAPSARVVVYCAHDQEFADDILRAFQQETGITVEKRYDNEANKSVSLYEDLIREAEHPRCDVHWNNEILATIRLQRRGLLEPYASPAAVPYPAPCKAADHTWTAFAARARVLLVNTDRVKPDEMPRALWELTEPRWKGRLGMAKPMFGTTATQAACLFEAWGEAKACEFYEKLHANAIQIVPGNKQAATGVSAGQFDIALTDTDDAAAEVDAHHPVRMLCPEGVLLIPNTVAIIKGSPNPAGARKLVDFLLSPTVEASLARSASRQLPLNPQAELAAIPFLEPLRKARRLDVDFSKAAERWPASQQFLVREFALR